MYKATTHNGWNGRVDAVDKDEEVLYQWSFAAAVLFSITVITSIGRLTVTVSATVTVSLSVSHYHYVDDFLICYRSKHIHIIERHLQQCLNKLGHWTDTNGFKFSTSKTVCIHF